MHSSYRDLLSSYHLKKRVLHRLHFPIPSSFFDYNNNDVAMVLQGVFQTLQISKTLVVG
jgi:hypothetical protein